VAEAAEDPIRVLGCAEGRAVVVVSGTEARIVVEAMAIEEEDTGATTAGIGLIMADTASGSASVMPLITIHTLTATIRMNPIRIIQPLSDQEWSSASAVDGAGSEDANSKNLLEAGCG